MYYIPWGRTEPQEANALAINTTERISRETRRAYLYGDADQSVGWEDVEAHGRQAKERGALVRMEKFIGGAHVAQVRVDGERYWRVVKETWEGKDAGVSGPLLLALAARLAPVFGLGGAPLARIALGIHCMLQRGRQPLLIVEVANALVLLGAGGAFLVKGVLLDVDAARALAEPALVLGLEARELLSQVGPGLRDAAARAHAFEDDHATHDGGGGRERESGGVEKAWPARPRSSRNEDSGRVKRERLGSLFF
ncbi:hypothetical protein NM208_g15679 [Fusarium decemcellulare]|uniref:Uncharacterized protein n=1 Tax=Fusarium decemcellulare TaxID=57161 RepID=A0ACC1RCC3_9HYPO|nr:hypothetical protein NM208_g15679 [Fusarium decemcellulare]